MPNSVRKTGTFGRVGYTIPDNSFTYVSEAWGSTSWLDHCFATKDGDNIITSTSVDYDCNLSDHFPLNINVCCHLAPKLEERCSNRTQKIGLKRVNGTYTDTLPVRDRYPCGCPTAGHAEYAP